jgi:hypothetical protein
MRRSRLRQTNRPKPQPRRTPECLAQRLGADAQGRTGELRHDPIRRGLAVQDDRQPDEPLAADHRDGNGVAVGRDDQERQQSMRRKVGMLNRIADFVQHRPFREHHVFEA